MKTINSIKNTRKLTAEESAALIAADVGFDADNVSFAFLAYEGNDAQGEQIKVYASEEFGLYVAIETQYGWVNLGECELVDVYTQIGTLEAFELGADAAISVDNGLSFTTPAEAIEEVGMDAIRNLMDDSICDQIEADTDEEFIERYLELANENLIIG